MKKIAPIALALMLAACASRDTADVSPGISYIEGRPDAEQVFPDGYREQILAFFRSYLNDPSGTRDASLASPVQRVVGGRPRYVSCVKYTPRASDGRYLAAQETALMFVNGRLDRAIEKTDDICRGLSFTTFPELQALTR